MQAVAGRLPEAIAQLVQRVENQEVGAKQHQLVDQRQMGNVGAVASLELLDQLVFAATFGLLAQQHENLLGQVHLGFEFIVHRLKPSTAPYAR